MYKTGSVLKTDPVLMETVNENEIEDIGPVLLTFSGWREDSALPFAARCMTVSLDPTT